MLPYITGQKPENITAKGDTYEKNDEHTIGWHTEERG